METSGLSTSWRPDDTAADWAFANHAAASMVRDQPAAILADQPGPRVANRQRARRQHRTSALNFAGGRAEDTGAGWCFTTMVFSGVDVAEFPDRHPRRPAPTRVSGGRGRRPAHRLSERTLNSRRPDGTGADW